MKNHLAKFWDRYRRTPKALKWVAWALLIPVVIYLSADWLGRYRLERFHRHWEKQGVVLRWDKLQEKYPPLPPERDFCEAPLVKEWLDAEMEGSNGGRLKQLLDIHHALAGESFDYQKSDYGPSAGKPMPLFVSLHLPEATQEEVAKVVFSKTDSVKALEEEFRSLLDTMQIAPLERERFLTGVAIEMSRFYVIRARANLALREAEGAMEDILAMIQLARMYSLNKASEMTDMGQMLALSLVRGPIWEGLVVNAWSQSQLENLHRELSTFEFTRDVIQSLHVKLASHHEQILAFRHQNTFSFMSAASLTSTGSDAVDDWLSEIEHHILNVLPKGVWCDLSRYYQRAALETVSAPSGEGVIPLSVDRLRDYEAWLVRNPMPHPWMEFSIGNQAFLLEQVLSYQQRFDILRIAVALELWRMDHAGTYPATLGELVPQFLEMIPEDRFVPGSEIRYEQRPNARYRLSACGKDGTYESLSRDARGRYSDEVWQFPEP